MNDWTLGAAQLCLVHETYLREPIKTWFPAYDAVAVDEHRSWLEPHFLDPATDEIIMPVKSWIVRLNGKIFLIDTCLGNCKDRAGYSGLHMLDTPYLDRFRDQGLRPEDVDYVMCTHLHLDHVGWNTRLHDGRWVPTFPNARYVFAHEELSAMEADLCGDDGSITAQFARLVYADSVRPILDAGLAMIVKGQQDLNDGFTITPAPGHSPGHVRIELRSDGQAGVFCGDMLHSPIQVPLWQWTSKHCHEPKMAIQSRLELLRFCVTENALLIPTHFDTPHVGRVRETANGFRFDPGWAVPGRQS
jgi:glyoxylase-like metal-dependent hydrolase (beta-lactamase superfamily II)